MPSVSVIIPVYNEEGVLRKCLRSVLSQTLRDIEILCVDDGSTDGTAETLDAYAADDPRVRVFHRENAGAGPARNFALSEARGEFVAFMDADDWYPDPDVLATLYAEAKSAGVEVCGGSIAVEGEGEERPAWRFAGNVFAETKTMAYTDYQYDLGYTRFIYSRRLLREGRFEFPDLRRFQDPPFFVRVMSAAGRFRALARLTYVCRPESRSPDWFGGGCRKVVDLLRGLRMNLEFAREKGYVTLREYACRSVDWTYCWIIRRGLMISPDVRQALDEVEAVSGYRSRPSELAEAEAKKRIRIFMVYHKPSPMPEAEPFEPIQVGPAGDIPEMACRDNTGDNIAAKNPNFCELTAQYWIWKNVRADYVGLMHYRRLISFTRCADGVFADFSEKTRRRFGWNEKRISALLKDHDILLPPDWEAFPPGEPGHVMTPYEFHCYEHRKCDIDAALAAIHDLTPDFDGYAKKALCEDVHECFGNICVMRKDLFDSYSEWLFKVLFEVERRIEIPKNREEARLFGFLSERLVMVWLAYAKERLGARVWHSPAMPFGDFGEDIRPGLSVRPHDEVADPMVSVIVPVYNTVQYLPMCLNSICGQCFDEIEVLCIDDGSTDGSTEILHEAAERDRRIRVIRGSHRGPGAARNLGIAEARGRYLAFVDSDDWVDRFIWFRSVRKAERDNLDLVVFEVEKVDDETGVHSEDEFSTLWFEDDESYHGVFRFGDPGVPEPFCACCYPVNRLVRRDLWGETRFPEDVVLGEDVLPHVKMALSAKRVGCFRQPFYFYRQRKGSSMTRTGRIGLDHLKDADRVIDYIEQTGQVEAYRKFWPFFIFKMMETTYRFWPTRECYGELVGWSSKHRELIEGSSCRSLRALYGALKRGPYSWFVAMYHALVAYHAVKAPLLDLQERLSRKLRRILERT